MKRSVRTYQGQLTSNISAGYYAIPLSMTIEFLNLLVELPPSVATYLFGRCKKYAPIVTRPQIRSLPSVLTLNAALESNADVRELWATPGWLPIEIGLVYHGQSVMCFEGEGLRKVRKTRHHAEPTVYELVGFVADIDSGEKQKSHLVSLVNGEYICLKVEHHDVDMFPSRCLGPTAWGAGPMASLQRFSCSADTTRGSTSFRFSVEGARSSSLSNPRCSTLRRQQLERVSGHTLSVCRLLNEVCYS